jgi:hypothetical protein
MPCCDLGLLINLSLALQWVSGCCAPLHLKPANNAFYLALKVVSVYAFVHVELVDSIYCWFSSQ